MLRLCRGWRRVGLVFHRLLRGRGCVLNPTRTAVVRHMIGVSHNAGLHNGLIHAGSVDDVYIHR